MKKESCCMKGQIDLDSWQVRFDRAQRKKYKEVADWQSKIPFRLVAFQKAYFVLKKQGKIEEADILEFRRSVCFEVYESVYINTLYKVFMYCRKRVKREEHLEILSDAYEMEYEWMRLRYSSQRNNSA